MEGEIILQEKFVRPLIAVEFLTPLPPTPTPTPHYTAMYAIAIKFYSSWGQRYRRMPTRCYRVVHLETDCFTLTTKSFNMMNSVLVVCVS